jgi:hypothetical protein
MTMRELPLPTLPMADLSSQLAADSPAVRKSLHPSPRPSGAEPAPARRGLEVVWARTEVPGAPAWASGFRPADMPMPMPMPMLMRFADLLARYRRHFIGA